MSMHHNLVKVAIWAAIERNKEARMVANRLSKAIPKPKGYYEVLLITKQLTARCSCCGRRLTVNWQDDVGPVCRKGSCLCK